MSVSGEKVNYTFGSEIRYKKLVILAKPKANEGPKHLFENVHKNCIFFPALPQSQAFEKQLIMFVSFLVSFWF